MDVVLAKLSAAEAGQANDSTAASEDGDGRDDD
jgi:hypothetical protein